MASIDIDELDRISKDALLEMRDAGECTSSELRDATEANSTKQIKYRCREYLLPSGIVEETQWGADDHGRDLPVVYSLTEAGEDWVSAYEPELADTSDDSVEERVSRLERQVRGLRRQVRGEQPKS